MSRSTIITITIILLVVIGAGVYTFSLSSPENRMAANEAGSVLVTGKEETPYTDLSGNPVELSDYAGNVLVVNSWASWCPFCVNELPDFDELAEAFADQDVVILAINREEGQATAERFLNSLDEEVDDIVFILDPADRFYKMIGGFSMPETVFYDSEGNISFHKRGFMTLEEMRTHTENALTGADTN